MFQSSLALVASSVSLNWATLCCVQLAKAHGEDSKVAIRNVRKDVMKKVGAQKLPEDDEKSLKDEIQKLTDSYVKQVDEVVAKKSKELTTV